MVKRTMEGHIEHLRNLAKARKRKDPEAAEALNWAADMLEVSGALTAALMRSERSQ